MNPSSAAKNNDRKIDDKKFAPPPPPTPNADRDQNTPQNSVRKAKKAGRKKINIIPITDDRARQVTFGKRKNGILKKAHELSVLCGSDVTIMIFNNKNRKLFEYSNPEPQNVLTRYAQYTGPSERRRSGTTPELEDDPDEDLDDDDDDAEVEAEDESVDDGRPEAEPKPASLETSEVPATVAANKNRYIPLDEPLLASAAISASEMAGLRDPSLETYVHSPPGGRQVSPNEQVLLHAAPHEQSIPINSADTAGPSSKAAPSKEQSFPEYPGLESHTNHHFVFPSTFFGAVGTKMPIQIGNTSSNQHLNSQYTFPTIHNDNHYRNRSPPADLRRPITGHVGRQIPKRQSYYESLTPISHSDNPSDYLSPISGSRISLPGKNENNTITRESEPMLQAAHPHQSSRTPYIPPNDGKQSLSSFAEEQNLEIGEHPPASTPAPVWPVTVDSFLPLDAQKQSIIPSQVTPWSALQETGLHYPEEQLQVNRHFTEQQFMPLPGTLDSNASGSRPGLSAGAAHGRDCDDFADVDRALKRRKMG